MRRRKEAKKSVHLPPIHRATIRHTVSISFFLFLFLFISFYHFGRNEANTCTKAIIKKLEK